MEEYLTLSQKVFIDAVQTYNPGKVRMFLLSLDRKFYQEIFCVMGKAAKIALNDPERKREVYSILTDQRSSCRVIYEYHKEAAIPVTKEV